MRDEKEHVASSDCATQIPIYVHLVHGTWAYGLPFARCWCGQSRRRLWFQPGSHFRRTLQESSDAPLHFIHFRWSGHNSFLARRNAAVDFREHLARCIRRDPTAPHFVIAHSHGGTVAFEAIIDPAFKWMDNIAGVVSLATPFVSLTSRSHGAAGIFLPLLLPIIFLAGWVAHFADDLLLGLVIFGFVVFMLTVLGVRLLGNRLIERVEFATERFQLQSYEQRVSQTLRCPWLALRAPGDEASLTIGLAQAIELFAKVIHSALVAAPLSGLFLCTKFLWKHVGRPLTEVLGRTTQGSFSRRFWMLLLVWVGFVCGAFILGTDALDSVVRDGVGVMLAISVPFICLALVSGLIWLFPTLCLALVTGPEVLLFLGAVSIIAEAAPRCSPDSQINLQFVWRSSESSGNFAHTMHQSPEVVGTVARWIRSIRQSRA